MFFSRPPKSRKVSIHRAPTSPSLESLQSSLTQTSGGSTSTITQETVNRMNTRQQKKSEKRPRGHSRRLSAVDTDQDLPTKLGKPNVFAFMEGADQNEDGSEAASVTETPQWATENVPESLENQAGSRSAALGSAESHSSALEDLSQLNNERTPSITSMHSDSGISVSGISPERKAATGLKRSNPKSPIPRNTASFKKKPVSSVLSASSSLYESDLPDSPESYYSKPTTGQLPGPKLLLTTNQLQTRPKRDSIGSSRKRGYELLSSKLSTVEDEGIKPIFRRFETMNNRVLLNLQDEIVSIEEDLAMLDKQIAIVEGAQEYPASRRSELQAPPGSLHYHRLQLLGAIAPRLCQYNRMLASYQSLSNMSPTSLEQIKIYQNLLDQYQPMVAKESGFLDDLTDLVTVSSMSKPQITQQSSYELGAGLFLLILTFKFIPSVIARMVLGGAFVGAFVGTGRLPVDDTVVAGFVGVRTGIYAAAVVLLSFAIG